MVGLCVLLGPLCVASVTWAMPTETLPTGNNFGAQVVSSTTKLLAIFNGVTFDSFAVAQVPHGLDDADINPTSNMNDSSGALFKTKATDN